MGTSLSARTKRAILLLGLDILFKGIDINYKHNSPPDFMQQVTQIKETALYVKDLDRTEKFYHDKLELEVISREEDRHIFFKAGSSILLCFLADVTKQSKTLPPHYGHGQMHIAFEVPETKYRETKEWIREKGINIEHEQNWSDEYQSFYFRDPDGHSLEIVPAGMWD